MVSMPRVYLHYVATSSGGAGGPDRHETRLTFWPGGAASSQDRKPVSASGDIASSTRPVPNLHSTMVQPGKSASSSLPSASRRPTTSRSRRGGAAAGGGARGEGGGRAVGGVLD